MGGARAVFQMNEIERLIDVIDQARDQEDRPAMKQIARD